MKWWILIACALTVMFGHVLPAAAAGTLVVQARSSLKAQNGLVAFRTSVTGSDECGNSQHVTVTPVRGNVNLVNGIRVAELPKMKDGAIQIRVDAVDWNGGVIASRSASASMNGGVNAVTVFVDPTTPCSGVCSAKRPEQMLQGIHLLIGTGGDDLRGGNDNVDVIVGFKNGTTQRFNNINRGQRWADGCVKRTYLIFSKQVRRSDIAWVQLVTAFGGGAGGDNWNVDYIAVQNEPNGLLLASQRGQPIVRFTGSRHAYTVQF